MVPARNMSCAISALSRRGPDRRKAHHHRHDDAARHDEGQQIADSADKRVQRHAERILHHDAPFGQPLGARRDDVRLAKLVQQVGAQDANQLRRPRHRQNQRGHPEMVHQVEYLGEAVRGVHHFRRKQAADARPEPHEPRVQNHQRKQEIRNAKPNESYEREGVIPNGILAHGGVYADWHGENPSENYRSESESRRQRQPVADNVQNGAPVLHGDAEIALERLLHPF